MLSSILALSVKYKPVDVSLTVSCGLPPILLEVCGSSSPLTPHTLHPVISHLEPVHLTTILSVSSLRLLQIIALTIGQVQQKKNDLNVLNYKLVFFFRERGRGRVGLAVIRFPLMRDLWRVKMKPTIFSSANDVNLIFFYLKIM